METETVKKLNRQTALSIGGKRMEVVGVLGQRWYGAQRHARYAGVT